MLACKLYNQLTFVWSVQKWSIFKVFVFTFELVSFLTVFRLNILFNFNSFLLMFICINNFNISLIKYLTYHHQLQLTLLAKIILEVIIEFINLVKNRRELLQWTKFCFKIIKKIVLTLASISLDWTIVAMN